MRKPNAFRTATKVTVAALVALVGLLIVAARIFDHYVQFRKSDAEVHQFFSDLGIPGTVGYYTAGQHTIRYISVGADSLPVLLFLHGSPSSSQVYEHFFENDSLHHLFRMVAVDRPGYGGSEFGHAEPSIRKQADLLWPLLHSLRRTNKPLIVVAGSYGTSIACRLLMDHPDAADGLVLLAPSMAPGQEKVFWFAPFFNMPAIRWAVPRLFRTANAEKLAHRKGLEDMLPYWNRIRVPVYYMQGDQDHLIYPSNAAFARRHLTASPQVNIEMLPGRPHFFIYSDRVSIQQAIMACYRYILAHRPALR